MNSHAISACTWLLAGFNTMQEKRKNLIFVFVEKRHDLSNSASNLVGSSLESVLTTTTNHSEWCYQHTGIVRIQQQQVHSPAILLSVHPRAACSGNPHRNRLHQTAAWPTPPPGSGFAAITRHGHWQRSDGPIRGDQRVEREGPRPAFNSTESITPNNGTSNCS